MKMKMILTLLISMYFPIQLYAQSEIQYNHIFPLQAKHVHSSSIVECPNGDLLACWFHGSGERTADDVVIQGARLKKGIKKWSPVFLMADTPRFPDCNPVLFIDQNQRLWMFWIAVRASAWEQSILKYRTSTSYQRSGAPKWDWQDIILLKPGDTFAETIEAAFRELITEEPMWAEYAPLYSTMIIDAAKDKAKRQTGWMTRTHPTVLPGGRILLPLYSDGYNVCLIAISDDQGEHWRASKPIVGLGPIQPSIVRKKNGTLVAYMRDSGDAPHRVLISTSTDDGESWSPAVDTNIPNPGSSLEAIALKDGRWVMAYNDTEDGRHRMAVALSDDEGKTWKAKRYVGRSDNRQKSFGYPSLIQAADGMLHLTYSYKEQGLATICHCTFGADWIK
ncbi:MAG: sialidase family protein [Sedimentisphaerales bacterium]|nr:sialidase family protein [Sedimentisphaerales bacterium]